MKFLILFAVLSMVAWLASSVPINQKRILINRPTHEEMGLSRTKRYRMDTSIKGGSSTHRHTHPELNLRKGEYMCGDKICKLKPNVEPPGCNGMCQYPINPPFNKEMFRRT